MEEKDTMFIPVNEKTSNYIKVVGVGGGGGNAVNHMYEAGIEGVDFVLCNTDKQALLRSEVPTKIHLGKRELGAGNDPNVGRDAAMNSVEEINQVLDEKTKMIFVTAGMGGGTGTGAAPVVAKLAKDKGILTVGIVTLPFDCEGRRRKQQAQNGIEELKKNVDTLIVISSDKLRDQYGNMKLTEAFRKADDILTTAAKGIAEIITVTGYINIDFEDVKTVMKESGKAIMGTGRASGEKRAEEAIRQAINSPLLNDSNIEGAKNVLIYITYGNDEVSLDEAVEIQEYTQRVCGDGADVIWGNGKDESLGDDISVTLVATGFDSKRPASTTKSLATDIKETERLPHQPNTGTNKNDSEVSNNGTSGRIVTPLFEEEKTAQPVNETESIIEAQATETIIEVQAAEPIVDGPKVHSLDDDMYTPCQPVSQPVTYAEEQPVSHYSPEPAAPSVKIFENPFTQNNDDDDSYELSNHQESQIAANGSSEVATMTLEKQVTKTYDPKEELKRNRLRSLSLNYKTQKGLEELEKQPAYMRRNTEYEAIETDDEVSRYATSSKGISTENSFLHDNVD